MMLSEIWLLMTMANVVKNIPRPYAIYVSKTKPHICKIYIAQAEGTAKQIHRKQCEIVKKRENTFNNPTQMVLRALQAHSQNPPRVGNIHFGRGTPVRL